MFVCTGLIIDAFGELRDQQEQVKEDMEVLRSLLFDKKKYTLILCLILRFALLLQTKCFICGIGSDYFDTTPHGFETHTLEEHNLANYMWAIRFYATYLMLYNLFIFRQTKIMFLSSLGSSWCT